MEGTILADLTSGRAACHRACSADNGIREPLVCDRHAVRGGCNYASRRGRHMWIQVVLDEVDRKKLKDWFEAQPLPTGCRGA